MRCVEQRVVVRSAVQYTHYGYSICSRGNCSYIFGVAKTLAMLYLRLLRVKLIGSNVLHALGCQRQRTPAMASASACYVLRLTTQIAKRHRRHLGLLSRVLRQFLRSTKPDCRQVKPLVLQVARGRKRMCRHLKRVVLQVIRSWKRA